MKNNYKSDQLFVAQGFYLSSTVISPYIQYESFGEELKTVTILPRRFLLVRTVDDDGRKHYYEYKTGIEFSERSFESSFRTRSSAGASCFRELHTLGVVGLALKKEILSAYGLKLGYFIPAVDYFNQGYGIDVSKMSPASIHRLIQIENMFRFGKVKLSEDEEIASKQLDRKVKYRAKIKNK